MFETIPLASKFAVRVDCDGVPAGSNEGVYDFVALQGVQGIASNRTIAEVLRGLSVGVRRVPYVTTVRIPNSRIMPPDEQIVVEPQKQEETWDTIGKQAPEPGPPATVVPSPVPTTGAGPVATVQPEPVMTPTPKSGIDDDMADTLLGIWVWLAVGLGLVLVGIFVAVYVTDRVLRASGRSMGLFHR